MRIWAFALTHLAHFGIIYNAGEWSFLLFLSLVWILCMFLVSQVFFRCKLMCDSIFGAVLAHAGFNLAMMYSQHKKPDFQYKPSETILEYIARSTLYWKYVSNQLSAAMSGDYTDVEKQISICTAIQRSLIGVMSSEQQQEFEQ